MGCPDDQLGFCVTRERTNKGVHKQGYTQWHGSCHNIGYVRKHLRVKTYNHTYSFTYLHTYSFWSRQSSYRPRDLILFTTFLSTPPPSPLPSRSLAEVRAAESRVSGGVELNSRPWHSARWHSNICLRLILGDITHSRLDAWLSGLRRIRQSGVLWRR